MILVKEHYPEEDRDWEEDDDYGVEVEVEDPDEEDPGSPWDEENHKLRVLDSKCTSCIYRPGNLMHLHEGRKEQMQEEAVEQGGWITCHQTLKYGRDESGKPPETPPSICRGYWDVACDRSMSTRYARGRGLVVYVPRPVKRAGEENSEPGTAT